LPRSFNRTSVRLKHELGGGVFGIVTLQPHERSSETGPPGHWRATASRLQPHERSSETDSSVSQTLSNIWLQPHERSSETRSWRGFVGRPASTARAFV